MPLSLCNSLSSRVYFFSLYIFKYRPHKLSQLFQGKKKKVFSGVSNNSRTMTEGTISSFYNFILDYSVTPTYHKHFSKNVLELSSRPSLGIRTGFFLYLKYSSTSTTFSAEQQFYLGS